MIRYQPQTLKRAVIHRHLAAGWNYREISGVVGVCLERVRQLSKAPRDEPAIAAVPDPGPPPERSKFAGDRSLRIGPKLLAQIKELAAGGVNKAAISRAIGRSRKSVILALKRAG